MAKVPCDRIWVMKKLSLLFLLAIVGCGPAPTVQKRLSNSYIDSSTGTPVRLKAATETCDRTEGEFSYTLNYPSAIGRLTYKLVGAEPANDFLFLDSIAFEGEFERKLNIVNERRGKLYGSVSEKVIKPATALKLCPDQTYAYYSYEDASLKALMAIENSYRTMEKYVQNISPVKLLIAPIFHQKVIRQVRDELVHEKKTLVNNALYIPKDKTIVFLPVGVNEDGIAPFNGIPFWDVPLIGGHEYGHHIFSELTGNTNTSTRASSGPCFDNRQSLMPFSSTLNGRVINSDLVMNALDEAAADILAYYTLDNKLHNLHQMFCLAMNREVDSPIWVSNQRKTLNEETLDKFFNTEEVKISSCLYEVDFQDIHILGANVANFFHSLFEDMKLTKDQRMTLIIEWIKSLKRFNDDLNNRQPRRLLLEAIQNMLTSIRPYVEESGFDLCQKLSDRAPVLSAKNSCN